VRKRAGFLLLTLIAFDVTLVEARDIIEPEKISRVEAMQEDNQIEREAENDLLKSEQYRKLRGQEKRAQLEAMKLELQRKKKKRFTEIIDYRSYYDTNFNREPREFAKGSSGFKLIPRSIVDLGGDRITAILDYAPSFEISTLFPTRFDTHRTRRFGHTFSPRVEIPLGKKTFIRGNYTLSKGVKRLTTETNNTSVQTGNGVGTEIEYFMTKKFSVASEYAYSDTHLSKKDAKSGSSREHWFLTRFNYYITPKTALFVQAGGGESLGGAGRSFASTNLRMTIGVNGRLTQKSSAYINLGVLRKNLSEEPPHIKNSTSPFLELIYINQISPRTVINVIAGSDSENSFFAGNTAFLSQHLNINVKQNILRKLFFLFGIGVRGNTYNANGNESANPDESGQRKDHFINLNDGLSYELRRNITLGISHSSSYSVSTIKASNRRDHIFALSVDIKL